MSLQENRDRIEARIQAACVRAGRDRADVRLIWVSKNHPREKAVEALGLGARHFGENRVQEALEKFPLTDAKPGTGPDSGNPPYELHLIGRLQKNKIRKILPLAASIHSIDSVDLLEAVNRVAGELSLRRDVFLQVNTSREPAKGGFGPEALLQALESFPTLPHLRIVGLMTMGPAEGEEADARRCFRELRDMLAALRATPQGKAQLPDLAWLSMGMTGDFEAAVEEGAHFLRIGTGLFGERSLAAPI